LRVALPILISFLLLTLSTADISLADEITISVSGNKRTRTSYIENIINDYLAQNNIDSMANVDAQALKDLIVDKELFSEVDVNIVGNQIDIMVKDRWTLIPVPIVTAQSGQDTKFGLFVMESNLFGYGKTGVVGGLFSKSQSNLYLIFSELKRKTRAEQPVNRATNPRIITSRDQGCPSARRSATRKNSVRTHSTVPRIR